MHHVLPGSCTQRVVLHGASPSASDLASPLRRAVDNNIAAPADETSDSPPHSTRTPEPAGTTYTYGVPFPWLPSTFDKPKNPLQDRHFRALRAVLNHDPVKDRG
nr:hypothetical protein [Actinomycetes bacterium]